MSYQVIARKYRPQKFSDVIGQEHVTQTLINAISQKRIAHAYLFVGPRGTGKTTIARIFAKCLNCQDGPRIDYPEDDPRVKEITEGRSLDVLEIDGASNRGIDEIRDLRETVKYAPSSSRFKIYIIDEVHMLTKEAFNALLKTLEEPPAHVKFMFATTEAEKVLPTILSRCQRFDLRRISISKIVSHLRHIAELEKIEVEEAALHAIARGADGGMRDAESTLDQLISFCGEKIAETDVLSVFGLTGQKEILSLVESILAGNIEGALTQLDTLANNGKDLGRLLSDLLSHFRNLLVYLVSNGQMRLLEVTDLEKTALEKQSATTNTSALTRIMEVLTDTEGRLRDAASKKILMEVALLKCIEARNAVPIETVLHRLESMRPDANLRRSVPSSSSPVNAPGTTRKEPPSSPATAGPVSPVLQKPPLSPGPKPAPASGELEALWSQVAEQAGRASPFIKSYLLDAHPVSFDGKLFVIGYDPQFSDHLGLLDIPKNRSLIQTKLAELGHPEAQVKFIQVEAPANRLKVDLNAAPTTPSASTPPLTSSAPSPPDKASASPPVNREDFKNDPLIKKALEVFKGQIVDIRM